MNTFIIIILCAAGLFLLWVIIAATKMSRSLSVPTYKTYEFTIRRSKEEEKSYGDFDTFAKESFDLTLRDGYEIHGNFFPLDLKKIVIISHGHGDNKYTGLRFLQVFRHLGWSALIYDLRGHGHNEPYVCTMGLNESKDLIEIIAAVRQRFPEAEIGLHGLSMGCATTVMALKYKPDVSFVIADCGYGILRELCFDVLKSKKLPKWMIGPINLVNQLCFGYKITDVNPIDSLDENHIPILFFHGTDDKLISFHQSEWMFERCKTCLKELRLIPDTAHAQAWNHDPDEYEKAVASFLVQIQS